MYPDIAPNKKEGCRAGSFPAGSLLAALIRLGFFSNFPAPASVRGRKAPRQ